VNGGDWRNHSGLFVRVERICLSLPSKGKKGVKLQKKCGGLKKLNRSRFGKSVGGLGSSSPDVYGNGSAKLQKDYELFRGVTLPGPPAEPNSYERDAIDEQKERGD
jgi:hypothetical protein